ncbi:MAG: hypothetical protein AAFP77_08255 [Bacteroidota bacterium]
MSEVANKWKSELPWFIRLLGNSTNAKLFHVFCKDFSLSTEEPEDAIVKWYENKEFGMSTYVRAGQIEAIQFFATGYSDFIGQYHDLPFGLRFGLKKDEITSRFGKPDEVKIGRQITSELSHGGIFRYSTPLCKLAFTFSSDDELLAIISFEEKLE